MKEKKVEGLFNLEQNNEIIGTLRAIRENVEISGFKYEKVYVIETDKAIYNVAGAKVMNSIIEDANIKIGERIKIKYTGKKGEANKEYKTYEIFLIVE